MQGDIEIEAIPFTPLARRYVTLKDRPSAERLEEAKATTAAELAREFEASVAAFAQFLTKQPFFERDPARDEGKDAKSDARTYGWAMALKDQERVDADGDDELAFRYVEREIVPTRTRPQLPFDDEKGQAIRVDLILANASTGRPIIGELKIAADKDPYTGLIQALAGASQLVSPQQRKRLNDCLEREIAPYEDERVVDVYVLLAKFPARGRDRFDQLDAAVRLAAELETEPEIRRYLGRIRILAIERQVAATANLPQPAT